MNKFAKILLATICAALAAFFVWDSLPSEKKRSYCDVTEEYNRWNNQKFI